MKLVDFHELTFSKRKKKKSQLEIFQAALYTRNAKQKNCPSQSSLKSPKASPLLI